MLTLRPLPPSAVDHPDPVLDFYYRGLLRHWTRTQRGTAAMISRALAGSSGCPTRRRHGIEAREWRLVDGRIDLAHYVSMRARKGIHRLLNPAALPLRESTLKDKRRFNAFALAHGLPIPDGCGDEPSLGAWLAGQQRVVVKPNFSAKGKGVRLFERSGKGWRDDQGRQVDEAAMAAHLLQAIAGGAIMQAALRTVPELAEVSPGALPTLRIVTILDGAGTPEVVSRVLRLGGGGAPVDNFNRGGIAAAIRPCGAIGGCVRAGASGLIDVVRHPQTDAPFADRLPDALLGAAESLAASAHRALGRGYAIVGWDIGLSDAGTVLIEGNWNPGTDVMQLLDGRPLSEQHAGACYLAALARVPERAWMKAAPVEIDG